MLIIDFGICGVRDELGNDDIGTYYASVLQEETKFILKQVLECDFTVPSVDNWEGKKLGNI